MYTNSYSLPLLHKNSKKLGSKLQFFYLPLNTNRKGPKLQCRTLASQLWHNLTGSCSFWVIFPDTPILKLFGIIQHFLDKPMATVSDFLCLAWNRLNLNNLQAPCWGSGAHSLKSSIHHHSSPDIRTHTNSNTLQIKDCDAHVHQVVSGHSARRASESLSRVTRWTPARSHSHAARALCLSYADAPPEINHKSPQVFIYFELSFANGLGPSLAEREVSTVSSYADAHLKWSTEKPPKFLSTS